MLAALAVGGSQLITDIQSSTGNAGGLIEVTVPSHGFSTGYAVIITDTTGIAGYNSVTHVSSLNYTSWLVTVVDANNFTLNDSVWQAGDVYDGQGGQCLNWPTSKLIAYDNGELVINGATITLNANGVTTIIDNGPAGTSPYNIPAASLVSEDNATGALAYLDPFILSFLNSSGRLVASVGNSSNDGVVAVYKHTGVVANDTAIRN